MENPQLERGVLKAVTDEPLIDKNCLSYWFPKLAAIGIRVPKTTILYAHYKDGDGLRRHVEFERGLDGLDVPGLDEFVATVRTEADEIGYPCFLRSGLTSGKHNWENTCYVTDPDQIGYHIMAIVEFSALADFFGLPTHVWAVREFLPLKVAFGLPGYGNMPVAREFRGFVRDGKVECIHPYWPEKAVEQGHPIEPGWRQALVDLSQLDEHGFPGIAHSLVLEKVADIFNGDGGWSVDICQHVDDTWYVTDMAIAEESFHWEDCPNALKREDRYGTVVEKAASKLTDEQRAELAKWFLETPPEEIAAKLE